MAYPRQRLTVERLESRALLAAEIDLILPPPDLATDHDADSVSEQLASIEIRRATGVRGASLELQYDPQKWSIEAGDIRVGDVWGGRGMAVANVDQAAGKIDVFLFATREVTQTEGSLVDLLFHSDSNHPTDTPELVLQELRLNDGTLPWLGDDTLPWLGDDTLPSLGNDDTPPANLGQPTADPAQPTTASLPTFRRAATAAEIDLALTSLDQLPISPRHATPVSEQTLTTDTPEVCYPRSVETPSHPDRLHPVDGNPAQRGLPTAQPTATAAFGPLPLASKLRATLPPIVLPPIAGAQTLQFASPIERATMPSDHRERQTKEDIATLF